MRRTAGTSSAPRARGATYDAVLLDAFDADGIPPALFSEEFLRDVRAVLAPSGVFLANTFASSAAYAQESATARAEFGRAYSVRLSATSGNRLIVAARAPDRLPSPGALLSTLPAKQAELTRLGIDPGWVRALQFAVIE